MIAANYIKKPLRPGNDLVQNIQQAISLTNKDQIQSRIYVRH